MSSNRQSEFIMWINYRIRVTTTDGRVFVGTFLAFDKHMNLVMSETEEYSRTKPKNKKNEEERKRTLGLVILRGDNVISFSAISQPGSSNKRFNDIKKINNENNENNDIKMDNNNNNNVNNLGVMPQGLGIPNLNENNINNNNLVMPPNMPPTKTE